MLAAEFAPEVDGFGFVDIPVIPAGLGVDLPDEVGEERYGT